MVWEQHTANIIMMTKLEEKSRVRKSGRNNTGLWDSKDRVAQRQANTILMARRGGWNKMESGRRGRSRVV